jgi:tRNA(fMet)-specific endonuclease VapC
MKRYVFDTDHLSLYSRNHPVLLNKLRSEQIPLITTVINLEEQVRGRLCQVSDAKNDIQQSTAYRWLTETIADLSTFQILQYESKAQEIFKKFKTQRVRIGTQDLRIGSIALANEAVVLTRNLRDFEKIPGLTIEDWSI